MSIDMIYANIVKNQENMEIFCPMCEVTHENNTWCQYPGNFYGEINNE